MGPAHVSVYVYVDGDTTLELRQAADGSPMWLDVGDGVGSVAVFFNRAGLERVRNALREMDDRMPAPDLMAAA